MADPGEPHPPRPSSPPQLERRDRRKLLDVGNTLVRRMTGLRTWTNPLQQKGRKGNSSNKSQSRTKRLDGWEMNLIIWSISRLKTWATIRIFTLIFFFLNWESVTKVCRRKGRRVRWSTFPWCLAGTARQDRKLISTVYALSQCFRAVKQVSDLFFTLLISNSVEIWGKFLTIAT